MVERTKMSNRNKIDYAKKFNHTPVELENVEEVTVEEVDIQPEMVEEYSEPKVFTKEGIVDIKKTQTLNLREDMNTDAGIVKQLNSQESVIVDNEYHDWYHVITESGAEGYVMSKFIKLI